MHVNPILFGCLDKGDTGRMTVNIQNYDKVLLREYSIQIVPIHHNLLPSNTVAEIKI